MVATTKLGESRVTIIADLTIPSPRAQSVNVMKTADALRKLGRLDSIVLPWKKIDARQVFSSYGTGILPLVLLPCVNLLSFVSHRNPKPSMFLSILFRLREVSFAFSLLVYLGMRRKLACWVREPFPMLIAKALGHKTIFDVHNLMMFPRCLLGEALRKSDLCIALTPTLEKVIKNFNGNVIVSGDCVDVDEMERAIPLNLGAGKHVVYVGSISREKGVFDLLTAWNIMNREDAALWLVGGGSLEEVHQVLQQQKKVNIRLVGPCSHSEAIRYYKAATIIVVPTRRTPFFEYSSPMKLFEGAASGKPIVASDIEGNVRFIDDGVNGILFKAGDAHSLASALQRILDNSELAAKLSRESLKKVSNYTWHMRTKVALGHLEK